MLVVVDAGILVWRLSVGRRDNVVEVELNSQKL